MRFVETPLAGVWLIETERLGDERGWFARTYDAAEFSAHGLDPRVVQCSASYNATRDTLRGMHFQAAPHGETKLVRCASGSIFDVAVDLRPDAPTYCRWFGAELSADSGRMLFIPERVAHGFQTLADDTQVLYQMGHEYVPGAERGVRWDDPAFGIAWPEPASGRRIIAERDAAYADFTP
ncbi:MAG: dTDP-4-dehydrorhamnose 3,5-epimerase [Actinomycetota bacterium]|nr:dTDP-4-dehydrorhamnose 3,5-epimerase [Actinomycetota bacterium]